MLSGEAPPVMAAVRLPQLPYGLWILQGEIKAEKEDHGGTRWWLQLTVFMLGTQRPPFEDPQKSQGGEKFIEDLEMLS